MRDSEASRDSHLAAQTPATLPVVLLFAVGILGFLFIHRDHSWQGWWMENIPIFRSAIGEWLAGRTPYTSQVAPLYYIYPPVFIYIAGGFARLVTPHVALVLFLAAHFAATFALPLLLAKYFLRQSWLTPLFALMLFFVAPLYQGEDALFTCNIATLLYLCAFAAAVPGLRRNRWEWFYLAVIAVSLVKFPLLPLLLLPLLAGARQWLKSTVSVAVVALLYLAQKALWPSLYAGYVEAVKECVVYPVHYGFGVFGVVAHEWNRLTGHIGLLPYAVLGALGATLFGSLLLMQRRLKRAQQSAADGTLTDGVWIAMIVCAVQLMSPRLLPYDADVAVFCSFVLWVYAFRVRRTLLCWAGCFLPGLAIPYLISNVRLRGVYTTLLVLAAFAAAYWRLWRETAQKHAVSDAIDNGDLTPAAEVPAHAPLC